MDGERKIAVEFKAMFIVKSEENGIHSVDRDGGADGKGLNVFMIFFVVFRVSRGGVQGQGERERLLSRLYAQPLSLTWSSTSQP